MKEFSAAFSSSMHMMAYDGAFNFAQITNNYLTLSDQDDDYLGWVNGENKLDVEVEIVFDFMCPACLRHMTEVPSEDGGELNIFEYLSGVEVEGKNDDGMSFLDAIKLKLTPFPLAHPHVDDLLQVYFYLKHFCNMDSAEECLLNDYMFFCFENQ